MVGPLPTRALVVIAAAAGALLAVMFVGLMCGAKFIAPTDFTFDDPLIALRIPRVLLAVIVGAALAVAGAANQALLRNPLADPGVLGVSAGAAVGAAAVIVVVAGKMTTTSSVGLAAATSAGAFIGALICSLFVASVAGGGRSVLAAVLAGLALSALASAVLGFLTIIANDAQLRALSFWTLGSLGGATPHTATVAASIIVPALVIVMTLAKPLNALLLGDAIAQSLGVRVERTRLMTVLMTSVLTAAAIAPCGMVSFVGLVAPHVARTIIGADHRATLPLCVLIGASLVVLSDAAARAWVAPAELPLGIVTALFGAPLFFWRVIVELRRGEA